MVYNPGWSEHYDTIYGVLGVAATLDVALTGGEVDITVIDQSAGVPVNPQEPLDIQALHPAADIRVAELAEHNIVPDDLRTGTLVMNGDTWRIESHILRPAPTGKSAGEVRAFLSLVE